MTPQEIFDRVSRHLFLQGRRSTDGDTCLYRGPDGASCAVGCLIPDEVYVEGMERHTIDALAESPSYSKLLPDFILENEDLMRSLQVAHDGSPIGVDYVFDRSILRERLEILARDYSLSPDVLKDL